MRFRLSFLIAVVALGMTPRALAEQAVLKSGTVLRGQIDRDNSIVSIFDGLKRTIVRDTRIERIEPEPAQARQQPERFRLIQPLQTQGGMMPEVVVGVVATPWDELGQRSFQYRPGARKPVRMRQAINEVGPDYVRLRGIDGFWQGQLTTKQVPKEVILGLLGRMEQTNQSERLRYGRFLIQAEWYDEALVELDRIAKDFPDLGPTVENVRRLVHDLSAQQRLEQADQMIAAQQPKAARAALRALLDDSTTSSVTEEVRQRLDTMDRAEAEEQAALREIEGAFRGLPEAEREPWRAAVDEIVTESSALPDLLRSRLGTELLKKIIDPGTPALSRLALAASGWSAGRELATDGGSRAAALWQARELSKAYLAQDDVNALPAIAEQIRGLMAETAEEGAQLDLATISQVVSRLSPPRATRGDAVGQVLTCRVTGDGNATPTEYLVILPPEYSPLREYPAVVALDDGRRPEGHRSPDALDWWKAEAARNGYILIAPDYITPGLPPDYRYSPDEHAAVELAIRDARRRFAIDSDRLFISGILLGGNMAWDFGLAHPDMFAGVAVVGGLPAKYALSTKSHAAYVPLYVALGDLAPGIAEMVGDHMRSMISRTWDITYVEYLRRGLEPLPEEAPAVFDWMNRRRRQPYRDQFEVVASRSSDNRFFGMVVRRFAAGRMVAPEAVDPLGNNLKPATIKVKTSTLSHLITLNTGGVEQIDVWLSPSWVKPNQRLQIRANGKRVFFDVVKEDPEPLLEDARIRGDRRQLYWAKIPLG